MGPAILGHTAAGACRAVEHVPQAVAVPGSELAEAPAPLAELTRTLHGRIPLPSCRPRQATTEQS
jgi:hypothetical protein